MESVDPVTAGDYHVLRHSLNSRRDLTGRPARTDRPGWPCRGRSPLAMLSMDRPSDLIRPRHTDNSTESHVSKSSNATDQSRRARRAAERKAATSSRVAAPGTKRRSRILLITALVGGIGVV